MSESKEPGLISKIPKPTGVQQDVEDAMSLIIPVYYQKINKI